MTTAGWFCAVCAAVACYLMLGSRPVHERLAGVSQRRSSQVARVQSRESVSDAVLAQRQENEVAAAQRTARLQVIACVVAGCALFFLVGGVLGVGLAVGVVVFGPRALRRLEPADDRRRRVQIEVSAAMVADLLAACVASGASTPGATAATAQAIGGPSAELLRECVAQFELGADHRRVWLPLTNEPSLAPIARAILRSAETGAPLSATLLRVGDDLRSTRKAQLDQAAKAVGVKAVGPLGLCFLPAFMLLGVVPLIASLIANGLAS